MATGSCCSTPRTAVAGARSATSAQAPCRSTKRSSVSATIHISWNCARPTVEPLQRIDAKQECRSLETTELLFSYVLRRAADAAWSTQRRKRSSSWRTRPPGSGAIGCLRLEFGGTVDGNSGPVRGNLAEWPVDGLSAGLRHVNLVLSAPFSHHAGSPRSSLRKW